MENSKINGPGMAPEDEPVPDSESLKFKSASRRSFNAKGTDATGLAS